MKRALLLGRPPPPVIMVALLLTSLVCGSVGLLIGHVDVSGFIFQHITQANGKLSPQTEAWLRNFDFRSTLLQAAGICSMFTLLAWRMIPAWRKWLSKPTVTEHNAASQSICGSGMIAALGTGAVLLRYFPTLQHGYFRYDDFDLVSVAHLNSWWHGFWIPHGDHFLPGTRLLASVGYVLFGVSAWPYNLGVLAVMAATVTMGCLVLTEVSVSRAGQLLFVSLVVPWSPWAEIMSGYYILSSYILIAALGLSVVWCYLRWRSGARGPYIASVAVGTLAATLLDISGWYVPAALGVFIFADFVSGNSAVDGKTWLRQHRKIIAGTALVCALSLTCTIYAYAVNHRGLFLSMGKSDALSGSRLLLDFAYLFDAGLLVSCFTPFVYARLPPAILGLLATGAFLGWFSLIAGALRVANRPQRIALGKLAAVMAGICLMVNLGRPSDETVIVRWAAKHVGPAFVWLCLLISFAWDIRWSRTERGQRPLMAELTLVCLGVYWCAQTVFGQLGLAVAFPPFGYPAEIRDAIDRRAGIKDTAENLWLPLALEAGPSGITAPTLDGPFIARYCPGLFEYNLATYTPFLPSIATGIHLVRNAEMHPWPAPGVVTVPSLRAAVSGEFVELLRHNSKVRDYYFGVVPLRFSVSQAPNSAEDTSGIQEKLSPKANLSKDTETIISDGKHEVWVRRKAFDPESAPILTLVVERLNSTAPRDVTFNISFTTDIADATSGGSIKLPAQSNCIIETDLRQLYSFSLSRQVKDVRLVLSTPGEYRLQIATLSQ